MSTEIDHEFLSDQNKQLFADFRRQQDDLKVITAMITRLDHTVLTLLDTVRTVQDLVQDIADDLAADRS